MTLKDLTDRHAVLEAIKEYDELGQQDFLEKYGFGTAHRYLLVHESGQYDSKAIAGVAHLNQTGTLLRRNEFTGGLSGAIRTLRRLGFQVRDSTASKGAVVAKGAVELLWNPEEHPWADLDSYQMIIRAGGTATGRWNVGSTKTGIEPGDRIFLFLVGGHRRGLVGSGHAASRIFTAPQWKEGKNGDTYINVAWDMLVDPDDLLPWESIAQRVSGFPAMFQESGRRLNDEQSINLEELWQERLEVDTPGQGLEAAPEVRTDYGYSLVRRRNHQRAFRALLFRHYDPVCDVCRIDQIEILEAAHIVPDAAGGPSSVENGRLLCPNHHRAHDARLFEYVDGKAAWSSQAKDALIPSGNPNLSAHLP